MRQSVFALESFHQSFQREGERMGFSTYSKPKAVQP